VTFEVRIAAEADGRVAKETLDDIGTTDEFLTY
jgi:hypothetical protein